MIVINSTYTINSIIFHNQIIYEESKAVTTPNGPK